MRLRRVTSVEDRRVLVVDDVFTSGATTEECCRILKRAGALRVFVAAVARA
jgi:predicted amidophosphoribosyltransferase